MSEKEETTKIFRVVEEDIDGDGKNDLTVSASGKKIATFYDWKSMLISWVLSTTSLLVAGIGLLQFW